MNYVIERSSGEKMQLLAKYQELRSIFHSNVTMVSLWFVTNDIHLLDRMRIKFRIYDFIFFVWFSTHIFSRIAFTVFINRSWSLAWLCNTAYCNTFTVLCFRVWRIIRNTTTQLRYFFISVINHLHVCFYGSANQICSGSQDGSFSVITKRVCAKKAYH